MIIPGVVLITRYQQTLFKFPDCYVGVNRSFWLLPSATVMLVLSTVNDCGAFAVLTEFGIGWLPMCDCLHYEVKILLLGVLDEIKTTLRINI